METIQLLIQLRELDIHEQIGLAYMQQTGHTLEWFYLVYFLQHTNGQAPYDFSCFDSEEVLKERRDILQNFISNFGDLFTEPHFISDKVNAELDHVPRYIDIYPHKHDFFEVICVLEGTCVHQLEDETFLLKTGDISIVPPNLTHHLYGEPDCVALTIKMRKSTFDQVFSGILRNNSIVSSYFMQTLYSPDFRTALTFHCGRDTFIREQVLYMYMQQLEQKPYAGSVIEGLLEAFFPYIVQNYEQTLEFCGETVRDERINEIRNYIYQNYKTATLSGVAKHFYLSSPYLSKLIHENTGQTFSQLVRTYKLQNAARLLEETSFKLDKICEAVGYKDSTQFIRTFKNQYGMTPQKYRQRNRESDHGRETM